MQILLRDPFKPADFEDFISERQRTLRDALEYLLVKERLDLPPNLRALDASIEKVELGLRGLIANELGDDPAQLPPQLAKELRQILGMLMSDSSTRGLV